MASNEGPDGAETDSRTSMISAKRRHEAQGSAHTPTKRLRRDRSIDSLEIDYYTASSDGEESDHSDQENDDDEAISLSSGDGHSLPDGEGVQGYSVTEVPLAMTQASNSVAITEGGPPDGHASENDLDLPLEEILQRLPTKQDFVKAHGTKRSKAKAAFERQQKTLPLRANIGYVKRLTQAFHQYHEAQNRLIRVEKKGKANIALEQQAVRDARVELAWCVYYPIHRSWREPPTTDLSKVRNVKKKLVNQEMQGREFLARVAVCLDEGTLLDLRHGKFGGPANFDPAGPDAPRLNENQSVKKLLARKRNEVRKIKKRSTSVEETKLEQRYREINNLMVDYNYSAFFPGGRDYAPLSSFKALGGGVDDAVSDPNGTPAQIWRYMRTLRGTQLIRFREHGHIDPTKKDTKVSRNSEGIATVSPGLRSGSERNGDGDSISKAMDPEQSTSSVLLNLSPDISGTSHHGEHTEAPADEDLLESGEISAASDEGSRTPVTAAGHSLNSLPVPPQLDGGAEARGRRSASISTMNQGRKVLADLSAEDLNAQLKYFKAHLNPQAVSLDCAVRCLCCGQVGHMASECSKLICSKCSAYNIHLTSDCDQNRTCSKCRETGHDAATCPYKLKAPAMADKTCELCSFAGHQQSDCELIWRTSGAPWKSRIDRSCVSLFCHDCGKGGHLGNDCPNRRPGKAPGTSTWSVSNQPPVPQKGRARQPKPAASLNGLSIKGHAADRLKLPAKPPSKNAGPRNSAALPMPNSKGKIQINPGIAKTSSVNNFQPEWLPVSETNSRAPAISENKRPRAADQSRELLDHKREREDRDAYRKHAAGSNSSTGPPVMHWPPPAFPAAAASFPNYEADMQYQYQTQAQPAHPPYPPQGQPPTHLGNYAIQPPPQQQYHQQSPQRYQPMPSAGRNAMRQFRR